MVAAIQRFSRRVSTGRSAISWRV